MSCTNHKSVSRRRFLRCSVEAAAVTVAAPYVIPSGVLAAPGRPGANDRIGIGGIGVGRQGGAVVRHAAQNARIVAVADVNEPRGNTFAQAFKAKAYKDYRSLLERKDVDAVITATPDHWRALICIHACQAGKDVYAEKPMSLTIHEGRLMAQAVRKYDRVFQTGSHQRSMAANRLGCELIRNGWIGKVTKIIAHNYPSPWECALPAQPVPAGLDWDLWCGPTELVPYNLDLYTPRAKPGWISFRPYSGGEMTGWGAHGLDQIQWALGMDDSGPVEVWTEGAKFNPPTYGNPESRRRGDTVCSVPKVFFRYADGAVVEFGSGPPGGAIFIGEQGNITIDRGVCKSDPPEIAAESIKAAEIHLTKSDDHVQNWLDCIKTRERAICDAEVGHRSATICHLGNIARLTGRKLRWDPVKEIFPDDAEASGYLDRKRRKPYELPERV
jgi:predicted dehydrogenase